MATLEDAAEELAVRLKELDGELEEGQESLAGLGDSLASEAGRLEDEWKELGQRVAAFLDTVGDHAETLDHEVQEAGEALATLQGAVAAGEERGRAELSEGEGDVAAFTGQLEDLQEPVESLLAEQVESPLDQLEERAAQLREALDAALAQARAFLEEELKEALESMGAALRQAVEEAVEGPLRQGQEALGAAYEEWEDALGAVEEATLERSLALTPGHAQDVVAFVLEELDRTCSEAFDELEGVTAAVDDTLRALEQETARMAAEVAAEGEQALHGGLLELRQAVVEAASALEAVKQRLARFTFVQI